MFQTYDILQTPDAVMTVAEVDDRPNPAGLALEFQLLVVGNWSFAS